MSERPTFELEAECPNVTVKQLQVSDVDTNSKVVREDIFESFYIKDFI